MKEQSAKKWFIKCLITITAFLFIIALIMIIVDPYFHYHKPFSFQSYRLYDERYINDGISRHFEYDAMITGTSMAQNFKPSEMDDLFGTTSIKAPFAGAGYKELSEHIEASLIRNPDLKTVILAVDYNGLLRDPEWKQYETYPTYLYDNNPFNDVSYLFNKSILYHGVLPNLVMTLSGKPSTTMDEYSSWERETGLDIILGSYDRENVNTNVPTSFGEEERNIVETTINDNIISVVNRYSDTTFYIFYPPYSICYWDALSIKGTIMRQTSAEQVATELLLECPNVKLYNFFDQYDVVCNPDYYCDDGHYNAEINSRILQWMSEDVGLITKDNYLEKLQQERDFYLNYDYDSIYENLDNTQ